MLTVTHHKGTLLDFPLSFHSSSSLNGLPWKSSTRHPGVSRPGREVTTPLEMSQHFKMPMCQHRDMFPAHLTVKMALHIGSVWCSCHDEPAKLSCLVYFSHAGSFLWLILAVSLLVSISSPLESDVSTVCWLCDGPCFSLSSTSFSSVNIKEEPCTPNTKTVEPNRGKKY